MGAADLSFELWHNNKKLSTDNPIKVEWQTAVPPPDPDQKPVPNDFSVESLPVMANRTTAGFARKSVPGLGNLNGFAYTPPGGRWGVR